MISIIKKEKSCARIPLTALKIQSCAITIKVGATQVVGKLYHCLIKSLV